MEPTKAQLSTDSKKPPYAPISSALPALSAPGKVFLLGEYAVLAGRPALVSAVGPRFEMTAEPTLPEWKGWTAEGFHPKSPLTRLVEWSESLSSRAWKFAFEDPHSGAGGFGGSTAQFALGYLAMAHAEGWERSWERVWRLYRELTSASSGSGLYPPSGADLAVQWTGGTVVFRSDSARSPAAIEEVGDSFPGAALLVFSASQIEGRKTPTHTHLEGLKDSIESMSAGLEPIIQDGIAAARAGDSDALGQAMVAYAEKLSSHGLEVSAAREDRLALCALPEVAGAKGSGAMLSDAVVVALTQNAAADAEARARVIAAAETRGLVLVADGIAPEAGVL